MCKVIRQDSDNERSHGISTEQTKREDMRYIFYDEMTKALRHEKITLYCKFNDYLIFTFEEPYIQSRTF